jgi:predicted nuclease of predicted toxin-antitoxin system
MKEIRFLADVNTEKPLVDYLLKQGFDIKWAPDYNCQMLDEDLLQLANQKKRIFMTNDKDFGDLIFLQKKVSAGTILFRAKGQKSQEKIK